MISASAVVSRDSNRPTAITTPGLHTSLCKTDVTAFMDDMFTDFARDSENRGLLFTVLVYSQRVTLYGMVEVGRNFAEAKMKLTVEEERDIGGHVYRLRAAYAHMRDGTFCPNLRALVPPPSRRKKREHSFVGFVTSTSIKLTLVAVTPQPMNVVAKQAQPALLVVVDNTVLKECRCMVRSDRNVSLPYVAGLDPNVVKEDTGYLAH